MADPKKVKVFDGTGWVDIKPNASAMTLCEISDVDCSDALYRGGGQVLEYKHVGGGISQFVIVELFEIQSACSICAAPDPDGLSPFPSQSIGDYLWRGFYKAGSSLIGAPYAAPGVGPNPTPIGAGGFPIGTVGQELAELRQLIGDGDGGSTPIVDPGDDPGLEWTQIQRQAFPSNYLQYGVAFGISGVLSNGYVWSVNGSDWSRSNSSARISNPGRPIPPTVSNKYGLLCMSQDAKAQSVDGKSWKSVVFDPYNFWRTRGNPFLADGGEVYCWAYYYRDTSGGPGGNHRIEEIDGREVERIDKGLFKYNPFRELWYYRDPATATEQGEPITAIENKLITQSPIPGSDLRWHASDSDGNVTIGVLPGSNSTDDFGIYRFNADGSCVDLKNEIPGGSTIQSVAFGGLPDSGVFILQFDRGVKVSNDNGLTWGALSTFPAATTWLPVTFDGVANWHTCVARGSKTAVGVISGNSMTWTASDLPDGMVIPAPEDDKDPPQSSIAGTNGRLVITYPGSLFYLLSGDVPGTTTEDVKLVTTSGAIRSLASPRLIIDNAETQKDANNIFVDRFTNAGNLQLGNPDNTDWEAGTIGEALGSGGGGGSPIVAGGGGGETCGRLTVISGDAAGQGISGTIFYTPYMGNQVPLYNGESWKYKEFSELALPLAPYASSNVTNGTLHDVFMYLDGDTPKIDLTAWNEIVDNGGNIQDQTRIDPLTSLGGILVATSDPKRRYLGTIKVDSSGQTSNTVDRRLVWNMSNRTNEVCDDQRPFASYSIGPTGWRRLGGSDVHIEFVNGVSGGTYTGFLSVLASGGSGNRYMSLATAVNGPVQPELQAARTFPNVANVQTTLATSGIMTAKVGLNVLYALEAIEMNAFVNYVGTQADNRHTGGLKGAWSC